MSFSFTAVYQSIKKDTKAFEKLAINKTIPTPCDHEMSLYNLNEDMTFPYDPFNKTTTKFDCNWSVVSFCVYFSRRFILISKLLCF